MYNSMCIEKKKREILRETISSPVASSPQQISKFNGNPTNSNLKQPFKTAKIFIYQTTQAKNERSERDGEKRVRTPR